MSVLTDPYGRPLNYLRLSVTDRCNLRCYYCMPEEGAQFAARKSLLSLDEMLHLSRIFCGLGVNKIRITGGEPFVRPGLMAFLEQLAATDGLNEITLTTNGTLLNRHLGDLLRLGIRKVNLSLDALSPERFFRITRRDVFAEVYDSLMKMIEAGFEVKLNCVVAAGNNTEDIIPFIRLTQAYPISVRFLEEMPFNGGDHQYVSTWNYEDIYRHIGAHYPEIIALESEPASTSMNYRIPGHTGTFGIIPSFSRTFCGTCNRVRLSATGELRTCLYGPPVANLRDLLRGEHRPAESVADAILTAVAKRERDGFAAEAANAAEHHSMALLGG